MILIIILLVLIFTGLVVYLISRAVKEQKSSEPKQFSKEEIKKRPGSYFDGREV